MLAQRPRTDRAFERLYRHVRDVYRYALVVLPTPEDAEDVTQTTFMNAYRAFELGECPRAPKNWLIGIAHKLCQQRVLHESRLREVGYEDKLEETVPNEESPTAVDIRRALGQLPFDQRAALIMREVEGRSYAEIAEILNVSGGAVETLLFRARRALREQLEGTLTCHEAERADLPQARRPAQPRRAPIAPGTPSRVCGLRPLRPRPASATLSAPRARQDLAPELPRLVLRAADGLAEQSVGFPPRQHLSGHAGGLGQLLLSGSNLPLSPQGAGRGAGFLVYQQVRRVAWRHGTHEQAERRPRLDGLAGRQARRKTQGEGRRAGARRRLDAAEQERDRGARRHRRRGAVVLASPQRRLWRELICALCAKFFRA